MKPFGLRGRHYPTRIAGRDARPPAPSQVPPSRPGSRPRWRARAVCRDCGAPETGGRDRRIGRVGLRDGRQPRPTESGAVPPGSIRVHVDDQLHAELRRGEEDRPSRTASGLRAHMAVMASQGSQAPMVGRFRRHNISPGKETSGGRSVFGPNAALQRCYIDQIESPMSRTGCNGQCPVSIFRGGYQIAAPFLVLLRFAMLC